jgi:hypothetical protein
MTNGTLTICPNCHRGVDEKWHYCTYCDYRLLNEDGSRRQKPAKKGPNNGNETAGTTNRTA